MPKSKIDTTKALWILMVFTASLFSFGESFAQNKDELELLRKMSSLPWISGPNEGVIAGKATIKFGADLQFLGTSGTSQFLEFNGNPPNDYSFTLAKKDFSWFAIFAFNKSGYIKDDERIDADALLEQLKKGNEVSLGERKKLGLPLLYLEGWFVSPRYDAETKRLEWGTRLRGEDQQTTVNFTTRLLGRTGVMSATLVSNPQNLERDVVEFKGALRDFNYNAGEKYAEFKQGDKIAEYGLAALIVGGAAAAAAKSGAGKALFKFLAFGVLAALAAIGAFLKRLFGKK